MSSYYRYYMSLPPEQAVKELLLVYTSYKDETDDQLIRLAEQNEILEQLVEKNNEMNRALAKIVYEQQNLMASVGEWLITENPPTSRAYHKGMDLLNGGNHEI